MGGVPPPGIPEKAPARSSASRVIMSMNIASRCACAAPSSARTLSLPCSRLTVVGGIAPCRVKRWPP
jgi:hypothetical protein